MADNIVTSDVSGSVAKGYYTYRVLRSDTGVDFSLTDYGKYSKTHYILQKEQTSVKVFNVDQKGNEKQPPTVDEKADGEARLIAEITPMERQALICLRDIVIAEDDPVKKAALKRIYEKAIQIAEDGWKFHVNVLGNMDELKIDAKAEETPTATPTK